MKEYRLSRSGRRPIAFVGEEIAKATTRNYDSNRWVNVEVYHTDSDKYIVGVAHITCWQGERDSFSAEVFNNREEVISHIEEHVSCLADELSNILEVV